MLFDIIARTNGAEGSFRRVSKEAEGAAGSFDKLGKAAFGITAVFAAFAVNAAVKFESAMTRISTQAGVPIKDIKALGDAILGLSPKVGFNPEELATSLYHVESAFRTTGITAGKAIGIVENASKLAKIGNADLETTTQAIIGVLASNIKGVKDAQDAAAQLNQLVGTGDTNLQTVAKSIATGILPTAATLGLSFKDVAAGLATLTDNVTPADQAARVLKTSLLTLIKPSAQQAAAFEQLGLGTLQLGEDFHKPNGLLVGVQDLKTHLDAVFPATQKTALTTDQLDKAQQSYYATLVAGGTNAKDATKESEKYRHSIENVSVATLRANTVARALGGSKTAGTFLTLIQEIDRLKSKYDDFGTSAQAAAKFQEAWANQQKTAKQKLDELKASWDVFLVQAGNAILPDLKKIVDLLAKHPGLIKAAASAVGLLAAAWVGSKVLGIITTANRIAKAILGIGAASRTAAAESEAANVGGAAAGAGAGAAEGAAAGAAASRFKLPPLLKIAIPVVATVGAIKVLGLEKTVGDLIHGKIGPAIENSPEWLKSFSAGIGRALKATRLPGLGRVDTGNITGTAIGALANAPGFGESLKAVKADKQAIADFQQQLQTVNLVLSSSSKALVGNTTAAQQNRHGIGLLVAGVKDAAEAQFRLTGKSDDYTAALNLGIGALKNNLYALGLNKQQVDNLIQALVNVPNETKAKVVLQGVTEAYAALLALEGQLRTLAQPVIIPIVAQAGLTGVASPNYVPNIGQIITAQGGLNFGASGPGGVAGGIGHAMGGIAKGWSWVGERGPELIHVGSPSRVLTHEDSLAAVGGSGPLFTIGQQTIHNNVDAREVAQQVGASVRMAVRARRL
jgi:TP901 family phage tail tape measure protein